MYELTLWAKPKGKDWYMIMFIQPSTVTENRVKMISEEMIKEGRKWYAKKVKLEVRAKGIVQ